MIIPESFMIETGRLHLRFPSMDEIPVTFSATRYKGFNDGMLWEPPRSVDELIIPLQNNVNAWRQGSAFTFSIIKKADGSFIGRIAIRREPEPAEWNLGFWMHPEHQNKGYMSEAAAGIIRFGFENLSAEKIFADHAVWNKSSAVVLKKCGMVFSKYIENGFMKNGAWVSENRLKICKQAWLQQNALA